MHAAYHPPFDKHTTWATAKLNNHERNVYIYFLLKITEPPEFRKLFVEREAFASESANFHRGFSMIL